jgi:hypothetical protein
MSAVDLRRLLLILLFAVAAFWGSSSPAQAQLLSGCSCPAGLTPAAGNTCFRAGFGTVSAICPYRDVGHIAAQQQQQSFWGITTVLQQKRDRLQYTMVPGAASSSTGNRSAANAGTTTLGYASEPGQTNKLANPLASRLYDDAAPSAAPQNSVWGTWVQGLADAEHDLALSPVDVAHVTNIYAAQAGLDRTQRGLFSADDALVVGVVSSWTEARTGYGSSPVTMRMTGPGVGIYSEYIKGGFSTDLTTKFDFLNLNQDFAGAAPNLSIGVLNAGVNGNVQYKVTGVWGNDSNFIEPTAGFSLTHTSFAPGAGALGLEDAYTVRLQAGARIGTSWDVGNGVSIDGSLKSLVYGDAVAQGTSISQTATTSGFSTPSISPSDEGLVRGEIDPELAFNFPENYSLTASAQLRFGRDMTGGSASLNLRKQW